MRDLKIMSKMPRIEVKTISGTIAEIEEHTHTEQTEKKVTKRPSKKKAEAESAE